MMDILAMIFLISAVWLIAETIAKGEKDDIR